jgi:hypothetical protein
MPQKLEEKCKIKSVLEETTPFFLRLTNRHYSEYPRSCQACDGYDKDRICYLKDDTNTKRA